MHKQFNSLSDCEVYSELWENTHLPLSQEDRGKSRTGLDSVEASSGCTGKPHLDHNAWKQQKPELTTWKRKPTATTKKEQRSVAEKNSNWLSTLTHSESLTVCELVFQNNLPLQDMLYHQEAEMGSERDN